MREAQGSWFKPLIGQDLYDEIQTQAAGNTLTAANLALIARAKPLLTWYAYYTYLPYGWVRSREAGTLTSAAQNSTNADQKQQDYLRQEIIATAERHALEFVRWANENAADYPLYEVCGCDEYGPYIDFYGVMRYPKKTKPSNKWFTMV
jgi:hypothetical protein